MFAIGRILYKERKIDQGIHEKTERQISQPPRTLGGRNIPEFFFGRVGCDLSAKQNHRNPKWKNASVQSEEESGATGLLACKRKHVGRHAYDQADGGVNGEKQQKRRAHLLEFNASSG